MWPIQIASFRFIVCRMFHSLLTVWNSSVFFTCSFQLISSVLLQHHISKFSRYFWSNLNKTWNEPEIFLICFPKCPSMSATQSCPPNVAVYLPQSKMCCRRTSSQKVCKQRKTVVRMLDVDRHAGQDSCRA